MYPSTPMSTDQRTRQHALARHEAHILRQAAIDNFWRDVARQGAVALRWIARFAGRVAHRA